jgi:phosphoglycerate dehydrogenase-like enzyme
MTNPQENRLLILSYNCHRYKELLDIANLKDLKITTAVSLEALDKEAYQCNILLASPDLAYRALPQLPELHWMQSTWAGVNKLLGDDCRKDYLLTGVKDVFGPIMSEYVFCYILMHARNARKCYELQKRKQWKMPMPGLLRGKKIGIMGVGSIGSSIAATAKHFSMITLGYANTASPRTDIDKMFNPGQLTEFVAELDYLVAILPQTPETDHLINREVFHAMKQESIFINVGRGNVVDENSLVDALRSGEIAGAILDVFQEEPLPQSHPFWEIPEITITSHKAALTYPEDIAPIFVENYDRYVAGKELLFQIDFDKGY